MFFSFLPSEVLFPAAFFSSAEAFSPAVLSFPGRSLRPTLGPARCGTRYGVIAAHFQTNLRNSCKNRTPHPLRIAPPPPIFCRRRLPARSPPTPPHSSPPPAGTTPRLAPAPAVSPAVFSITAPPAAAHRPGGRPMPPPSPFRLPPFSASPSFLPPPSAVTTVVSPSSRRRRLLTSPATALPPHPLLSKKEEPTRPLFPTKSLSLQNMDGPPAKNARKRGLLPAPFRIFAHLYPRHARKTG